MEHLPKAKGLRCKKSLTHSLAPMLEPASKPWIARNQMSEAHRTTALRLRQLQSR